MSLSFTAILIVAGIGMIVGIVKQKAGATWGQPLAVLCAIVGIGLAIYSIVGPKPKDSANQFTTKAAKHFGEFTKKKFPSKKYVIIASPTKMEELKKDNESVVAALKDGLGSDVEIYTPTIPAKFLKKASKNAGSEMEAEEPLVSVWFNKAMLEKIAKKYPKHVIISTLELPELKECLKAAPALKKAGVELGFARECSTYYCKRLFTSKFTYGVVVLKSDVDYEDQKVPSNTEKAFNKRYILITPDNYNKYPEYFGK